MVPRSTRTGINGQFLRSAVSISTRTGSAALVSRLWPPREGFNLAFARRFKQALRVPVICVGGFHTRAAMEAALREGATDAISCGRAFIADPFLVEHLRTGAPGPRCDYCNLCLARATVPVDCFNPAVRAEKEKLLAEKGLRRGEGAT